MYRYETHLHTFPVSKCGHAGVEECVGFYKELGYDGIFITNHFLDGNINIDRRVPYHERLDFYFSDYEKARAVGEAIGIKVFCGVEISYAGTDMLVYGLDKAWFAAHPEIMEMRKSEECAFLMAQGALVIQAHPFREAAYIDHIRLFPRQVHGVEVLNSANFDSVNAMGQMYAAHYGLIPFAGSDNHHGGGRKNLAGMAFAEPIGSEADFVEQVKSGRGEIFTLNLE